MKRWLLLLLKLILVPIGLFVIYITIILVDVAEEERNANADPMNFGSFNIVESSMIDPATILSSINLGDQNLFNFEPGFPPDDLPFVSSVEWTQEDFLNLATSIFHAAWNESTNEWILYGMGFYTRCDDILGFSDGDIYFLQETADRKKYSGRGISIDLEYGYVMWGGDTYRRRPFFGWKVINLKEMTVTAEEALRRAEARGGMEFRRSIENKCKIFVQLWPEVSGRYDWRVDYWDDDIYRNRPLEFWIPTK